MDNANTLRAALKSAGYSARQVSPTSAGRSTAGAFATPPSGTLAAALAVMDAEMAVPPDTGETADDPVVKRAQAAWSTVRAAALRSLEPAATPEADLGSLTLRAHQLAKAAQDRISILIGDPSPDAEVAIRVANLAIAPSMTALMIEALEQISDRSTQVAVSVEAAVQKLADTLERLPSVAIERAQNYGLVPR